MKKLIAIFTAIAFTAALVLAPTIKSKAQNNSILLHKKVDGNGTFFNLDTLNGKAPVLIVIKDSIGKAAWLPPVQVYDSVSAQSFTNEADAAWVAALLSHQQQGNSYGILPQSYYYKLSSSGTSKLYFPPRIKYMRIYWKP